MKRNKKYDQKYPKEKLIKMLHELKEKLGRVPKKYEWINDSSTPSDAPIRARFINWNNFLLEAGYTPLVPNFTPEARESGIRNRKSNPGGNFKGGRLVNKQGYVMIWKPDHPNAKLAGYIHEHRLVMSDFLGRALDNNECVHHKNGDRQDNRIENLELWSVQQPYGQRVIDKLKYAYEIIEKYKDYKGE